MFLAILGRQPALSIAELEMVFGGNSIKPISSQATIIESDSHVDIERLGGTLKIGKVISEINSNEWSAAHRYIIEYYSKEWAQSDGKITLGISVYGLNVSPQKIQQTGIILKRQLKKHGVSLRLIPNQDISLNTATSHHNKLGLSDKKVELLIAKANNKIYLARSCGAQNITAYANRDQARPKRDAFVGMLPPKLAQIMINLTGILQNKIDPKTTLLDPFCGTGVVLQEALLAGLNAYGSDLSDKMIDYSQANLRWLESRHNIHTSYKIHQGDAMSTKWEQPINIVVGETYLGQPFSAPPSNAKLTEVTGNCNHIISEFLRNLASQIKPGTPLCIAVPAWRDKSGGITHLPLINKLASLGYRPHEFHNVSQNDMLYYREDQVVAREILTLTKI